MTFEKAIEKLGEMYAKALNTPYVEKPISWALYKTWREIDMKEKPRKEKENETN